MFTYYTGEYIDIPKNYRYINLENDLWGVFSPQGKVFTFNFNLIVEPFKSLAKEYVIAKLIDSEDVKISTLSNKFYILIRFLCYVQKYIPYLENLTSAEITGFLDFEENETNDDIHRAIYIVEDFLLYYKKQYPQGINEFALEELKYFDENYIENDKDNYRWRPLPTSFISDLIYYAVRDARNKNLSISERACACLLIIQTQIGLRISELENLEYDAIINEPDFDNGNLFKYKDFKSASKKSGAKNITSVLNPLALYYWLYLIALTERYRPKDCKKLFLLQTSEEKKFRSFQDYIVHFCMRHRYDLNILNNANYKKYMRTKKISQIKNGKSYINTNSEETICYPLCHQFRAYRINFLANHGVDMKLISSTVGHKNVDTTMGYYDSEAKNEEFVTKKNYGDYSTNQLLILKGIALSDGTDEDKSCRHRVPKGYCSSPRLCESEEYIQDHFED